MFFLFYYVYTIACNLVTAIFVCDCRKVDVCACKDGIKLNYFRSIQSHREPYTDYIESAREIQQSCRTSKSKIKAKRGMSRMGDRMGIMVGIMLPSRSYNQMILLCC